MKTKIAALSIIVRNSESIKQLNEILHNYADFIVGRMGIPYRERGISIISLVVDAPENEVNELSDKIKILGGISINAVYSEDKEE